ncbi:MAG: 1-acyl-sn-glycerol-3-phosphate acyltransferase [Chloroflexi bacterium]|nr:1-acyl-sn-glycerol-3-phosphate acyltransferase [Chloroflexota bacterium]
MDLVYRMSNTMMRGALRLFGDWEVEGKECVPPMGPLLVIANHQSNLDPPMLGASLPRRIHFMAKRGVFVNPLVSLFLRAYGAVPLERDGSDIKAINWTLRMLQRDAAIVVFPEGTRSPGAMRQAMSGVALIALRSGAPILPVGMTGTERIGPIWQVAVPRGTFRVRIGQPFSLPSIEGRVSREQLGALTTMIMERVAALLPESYRGVYSLRGKEGLREVAGEKH